MTSAVDGRTSGLDFSLIVEAFQDMEKTSSRLALIDFLVQLFKKTPNNLIDKVTYLIQGKLHPDYEGIELGIAGKMVMRAIASASGTDQARLDKIYQETGDIGDTASIVLQKKGQTTFFSEPMTVERVYSVFEKIALAAGPGSQESKVKLLQSLLNDATPEEGRYTVKFVLGELRLGIADYTVLDALAIAYTGDKANRPALENAYNVTSDLGSLARGLAEKGLSAATSMQITMFKPVRPMLAERAKTAAEALERSEGVVAVEFKLDGERVQLHKGSDKVEMFSRRLERITSHYPDVASAISDALPSHEAILEGEVVAVDQATHEYLPFQELMHRRRKHGIEEAMSNYPVVINLFDLLYLDGRSTLGLGYSERRSLLERLFSKVANKKIKLVEQIVARKTREIDKFTKRAIQSGCEGIMAKQLESTYRAGAREFAWMKLKKEYQNELADSLDLVIVGALFGRGRRVGSYGALLLAAYDSDKDTFQSISKVGTGFTDADLVKFFSELQSFRISHRHPRVDAELKMDVWFEPKIVIEVIASEITLSPLHTAGRGVVQPDYGLALRFPKFTGKVRDDKKPEDATTVTEVVEMYQQQSKKRPTTSQKAADDS